LAFLLDATTEFIEQTRKESKNYGVCNDNPLWSIALNFSLNEKSLGNF
jgi:hypothetical protein